MWIVKIYCSIDCSGTLIAIFWVITVDIIRTIMVMYDKAVVINYTCVFLEYESSLGLLLATEV